ncbi:MAG: hypothetical protein ABIV47_19200 [Roseiflexaceae bacterium]
MAQCEETLCSAANATLGQRVSPVTDTLKGMQMSDVAPLGAKDVTLGAKDSVKRTVAKGGTPPTGAKDSPR